MDEIKKFSPNMDIDSVVLEDIAPDEMIRVYPYIMPNTGASDMFMSENSTSLVYFTQEGLDTDFLEKDDNGLYYFNVLPSMTTLTNLTIGAGTSDYHQELSETYVFNALCNYYPQKLKHKLHVDDGQDKFAFNPMLFSMGEPLNPDKYDAHRQPVYLSSRAIAAKDSETDLSLSQQQIDGLYEVSFVNVTTLEQSYINSKIKFVNFDTSRIRDLKLVMPNNSLFGGINGKTIVNGSETDLSFSEPSRYPIWNAVPNSISGRLEMFMKWADTKMVLPIHIIDKFKTEQPLSKLFKDDADAWLADGEDLFHLLKDMLLYTKLYVDQWKDIQQQDKLADPGNSNYGQVKINVTVGSNNAPVTYQAGKRVVNLIAGKAPAEVTATLYETYLNDNPGVDKGTLAIFRAAVVALSRYIRTGNLALGGGLNDFNSIYLPWRLKTANKINITREESGGTVVYYIKEDPEILFDSHWFEYDGADLKAKAIDNLYETQLVQAERNISQPLVPDVLRAMDISSNPGGINTGDDAELAYNWWIPTTEAKVFDTLMLKTLTTTVTESRDQILNDRTARITDAKTLTTINEIKTLLGTNTLAADWASETTAVKKLLADWYQKHIETQPGSGFWNGVANFLAAFGPLLLITNTETDIIKVTGYDRNELESFGVAGADWIANDGEPAEKVWRFMKVLQEGFDSTGFDTINHTDQFNGQLFTANNADIINFPVQNWMREIKGSWLNKYLTDEAGLTRYLQQQAGSLLTAFNHPSWDTRAHQIPEAEFLKFFPGLKGHMTYTQFELRINGYLSEQLIKDDHNPSSGTHAFNLAGNWWWSPGKQHLEDAQAILKIEIIEQIPVIYPKSVHYKLKAGSVQSFNLGTNRKLIFTKDEWHNIIRGIRPTNYYEEIDLTPIRGDDLGQITELNVIAIWHDKVRLMVNNSLVELDAINAYDETITKQKVIFT